MSDLDPSGLDLQRAWQDALDSFGQYVIERIGLTPDQVADHDLDGLAIEVKPSDSRATAFVEQYRRAVGKADVLPAAAIEQAITADIGSWLDGKQWKQRDVEIEGARELL